MPEQPGFSTYDPEQRTLSRAPFRYRADEPETHQGGFVLHLPEDAVLVRRRAGCGDRVVYLSEAAVLVREGELFFLPRANAAELIHHPSCPEWDAAEPEAEPEAEPAPEPAAATWRPPTVTISGTAPASDGNEAVS